MITVKPIDCFSQWTPSSTNIYNTNTGNVGIGTTAPVYKLEVMSTTNAKLLIKSTSSPNAALLEINSPGSTGIFESVMTPSSMIRAGSRTNQDFTLITNNLDRLTIKNDGKVGINKTSPLYTLDVNGTINATALSLSGQAITSSQWTTSGSNINFISGTVSVGTSTAPMGFKLAVGGKIITEEIVVMLRENWPDFVFDDDYKLPPLSVISKYIREHKHLPGMPAAEDVEANGVRVGEMTAMLLRKVEELTLYLIKQEERILMLEKQLEGK